MSERSAARVVITLDAGPQPKSMIGAPVRFTRPVRYSLYRAADGDWYLGEREWNPTTVRFNTIQPVSGPFLSPVTRRTRVQLSRHARIAARDADRRHASDRADSARPARRDEECGTHGEWFIEKAHGLTESRGAPAQPALSRMRARGGIALFAALAVMALIGLLVAGAVASSTAAQRSSRLSFTDAVLTTIADYALNTVLADPRGFGLADLTLGERAMFDIPVPTTKDARVVVGVTRLPGGVLWLVADATIDADQATGASISSRDFRVSARCPRRASSRVVVSSWGTASSFNRIPAEIRNVRRMRRPM